MERSITLAAGARLCMCSRVFGGREPPDTVLRRLAVAAGHRQGVRQDLARSREVRRRDRRSRRRPTNGATGSHVIFGCN